MYCVSDLQRGNECAHMTSRARMDCPDELWRQLLGRQPGWLHQLHEKALS